MKHPVFRYFPLAQTAMFSKMTYEDLYPHIKDIGEVEKAQAEMWFDVTKSALAGKVPHIEFDETEWKSNVSKNTIKQIDFKDFKLPFEIFSMEINGELTVFVQASHIAKRAGINLPNGFIVGSVNRTEGSERQRVLSQDDFIYTIDRLGEEIFSAVLYFSSFKNDKNRVDAPLLRVSKKSKGIPKHTFNVIRLKQIINSRQGYSTERCKSEKMWIVRGHWRQQPYKDEVKPKWIDSYWKGDGKEVVQKVYKV